MDDVFLKAPYPKKPMDVDAYNFIDGFYTALNANSPLDQQALYNNIDGLGIMIYGPIMESMKDFNMVKNEDLNRKVFMTIHEISHSLLEGADSLVAKGALKIQNKADL